MPTQEQTQQQSKQQEYFDDLPLFHVPRHRQIWESLRKEERQEASELLTRMFLEHVERRRSIRKGDESHE